MIDLKKILKFAMVIIALIVLAQTLVFFDPKNETRNQVDFGAFKTKMALAQFFFPRYPERLKYVVDELNQASEQLVYYNGELKKLTNQCDCKNVTSQCTRIGSINPPSVKRIELNPSAFQIEKLGLEGAIKAVGDEMNRLKKETVSSINGLNIYLEVTKQQPTSLEDKIKNIFASLAQLGEKYKEGTKEGMEKAEEYPEEYEEVSKKGLEEIKTDIKLYPSEIMQLENQLEEFEKINNSLDEEKKQLEKLKQELKETPGKPLSYYQDILSGMENRLKEKINRVKELPNQLKEKLLGITQDLMQQITNLPNDIKNLLTPIKCKSGTPEVFGEPCPQRKEIERTQIEIQNKIDQISFLRELLQKEMESGLKAELETLREDEASQLESSLNEILASSQNIIAPANTNLDILNDEQYSAENQCKAECDQGIPFGFKACIFDTLGEQSPIEMIFEVGASLKELKLGEIGIKELGLNLPEKLELVGAKGIKDYKIPLPDITINIPPTPVDEWQDLPLLPPIVYHLPIPEIPTFPWANFSCPKIISQPYQCLNEEEKSVNSYIDLEWYLQTFSWLSEKCQEIPGLKDQYEMPSNECFDKERVHLTIINQCETLWQQYFGCIDTPFAKCDPPPGICASILSSSQRTQAIQRECQNLFKKSGETVPPTCNLAVLETKCSQIKESWEREIPESCEFLPLFTRKFEKPASQTYQEPTTSCSSQTITDNSLTGIRLDCALSADELQKLIPKIKLKDIIIPDIRLPSFSFPPFLKVKLPNFIFEDLIFPELNFCNLDKCGNLLPPLVLEIPYPILKIPDIEIPPVYISLPGLGDQPGPKSPLKIEIDKIKSPPIPIPLPDFDLTKLIALDLKLPEIPLPFPEILLDIKGLNINVMNLLLGLVAKIIDIPSGCIGGGIDFIPLVIAYPDYYFYWPAFPEIPDLCNNKHVSINDFCRDIKNTLKTGGAVKKVNEIQNLINQAVEEHIQKRLDEISTLYEELVIEHITAKLKEIEAKIKEEIEKNIQKALAKLRGKDPGAPLEIDPIKIPLDDIEIPMEKINAKLAKIPKEIPIPWPEELKKIKLDKPITYPLPPIPLDDLNYKKEIPLKLPGFQLPSLQLTLDFLGNWPSCQGQTPSGGNPYPVDRINVNLGEIINLNQEINQTRESINQVLR